MLSPFAERQMIEKSMNTGYDISEKRVLPDRRRSALKIMGSLIGLVKPLIHIMILAVLLGTAGYLCAIFLTILAGQILIQGLGHAGRHSGSNEPGAFCGNDATESFCFNDCSGCCPWNPSLCGTVLQSFYCI